MLVPNASVRFLSGESSCGGSVFVKRLSQDQCDVYKSVHFHILDTRVKKNTKYVSSFSCLKNFQVTLSQSNLTLCRPNFILLKERDFKKLLLTNHALPIEFP